MSLPRITIITPSYNSITYLEQTIISVVDQRYPNLEYLILDGGSIDGSRRLIKKYAAEFSWIHPIFKRDSGQWDAVNKGYKKATGDLLGYINADDIYCKGALNSLARFYGYDSKKLWYAGRGVVINENRQQIFKLASIYKNMLLTINNKFLLQVVNYLMQPSVFMSREAFRMVGDFSGTGKYILEYDTWLRLSKIEMPVIIPEVLSCFRITPGMASLNYTRSLLDADLAAVTRYTQNPLILALHKIHNQVRSNLA